MTHGEKGEKQTTRSIGWGRKEKMSHKHVPKVSLKYEIRTDDCEISFETRFVGKMGPLFVSFRTPEKRSFSDLCLCCAWAYLIKKGCRSP